LWLTNYYYFTHRPDDDRPWSDDDYAGGRRWWKGPNQGYGGNGKGNADIEAHLSLCRCGREGQDRDDRG